ncbi:VTT domain-containing protein [Archangium sp.]|uniref:TVP38/TMEM64 family protein n=1 Tax=Archangium sp. TaxID=1872627 RepID=UPI00286BBC6D|nr:VTT domain-containing protein [Archangium sp.]
MARGLGRWVAGVAAVVALVLAFKLLPVDTWLLGLVERIRDTGLKGAGLYVALYVVATVLVMPASVLTLGAGFAYGPVYGSLLVVVASNLGALSAFLLGRTALRERVSRRLEGQPRFSAVDAAVAGQGFKVVLLLRLSPLFPFNLLNYALGLTRVRPRDFVLASFLGMLPGTVLYVYLGSLVTSVAQLSRGQRPEAGFSGQLLFWGGLAATILVTVYVTRLARRALDATLKETPR